MKKKVLYVLSLCVFMFSLTGCVKFNANMDIKKDKSMDFSIIYAFDTSLFGDESIISDEEKSNLENEGFTVSDYSDGNMKGITLNRKIKNIDSVSSSSNASYDLSGIIDNSSDYIFTVKKGFLKNTYSAKFNFDASNSDLNLTNIPDEDIISDDEVDIDEDTILDDEVDSDEDAVLDNEVDTNNTVLDDEAITDIENDDDFDYSSLSESMANMDLSFNITLPYSAISNNANSTSDNNKQLSWSLASDQVTSIEFEFELYNLVNIAIVGGCALLLIVLVIILISKGKKNKRKDAGVSNSGAIPELTQINNDVKPFSEQSFNEQLKSQTQGIDAIVDNAQPAVNNIPGVQPMGVEPQSNPSVINPSVQPAVNNISGVQPMGVEPQSNPSVINPSVQPAVNNISAVQPMGVEPQGNPNVINPSIQPAVNNIPGVQPIGVEPQGNPAVSNNVINENVQSTPIQNDSIETISEPVIDVVTDASVHDSNVLPQSNLQGNSNAAGVNNIFDQPIVDNSNDLNNNGNN